MKGSSKNKLVVPSEDELIEKAIAETLRLLDIPFKYRGKGFGKQIVEECFIHCTGNIKLHVEYDNPAKRLYERIGFATKYAEMRYNNK